MVASRFRRQNNNAFATSGSTFVYEYTFQTMKKSINYRIVLMALMVITFNSCTLFIDDDKLFNSNSESLPTYKGNGYDEPVTGKGEYVDVTYQLYESTMTIQPEDELTKYIHHVDTLGILSYIYIDKDTPKDLIPKVGQMIVSGNIDLFPHHGLCDMVYSVEEKDGEYLIKSGLSKPEYAFKKLELNTHIPVEGLFDEYEVFDEDGNSLGVINQEEELNKIRANRAKGVNGVARKFENNDYDINFNTWEELAVKIVQTIVTGFEKKSYKKHNNNDDISSSLTIHGGINFPSTDIEANLNPFSDDPMFVNVDLGQGDFDLDIDLGINIGMDAPEYFNVIPDKLAKKLNTPKAFMIGAFPVVIIPNIFAQFGIQAKASINIGPWLSVPWGEIKLKLLELSREKKQERHAQHGFEVNGEGELGFYFLVNLGLGLYTDAVTFNAQPQIRWTHKLNLTTDDINPIGHSLNFNPTYTQSLDLGIGLKVVADGGSFAAIGKKISEKCSQYVEIIDKASKFANEYYEGGSFEEWQEYLAGAGGGMGDDDLHPEIEKSKKDKMIAEYEKRQKEGKSPDQIKEEILKEKAAAKKEVDKEMDVRNQKNVHKINKEHLQKQSNKRKKFELAFGPWWPAFLNITSSTRYWYPRVNNKTFHVGATFDKGNLVFVPSYQLEDHGLYPLEGEFPRALKYWVPGFVIKLGNEELRTIYANTRVDNSTESGEQIKVAIKDLKYIDETLTCYPFFELVREASGYGAEKLFRQYDRPIPFSVTTPAMAITRLELTNKPTHKIENGRDVFYCGFDVYVVIAGLSSIADWGIRENNSLSEDRYKSSSQAVAYSEGNEKSWGASYLLHYSIRSEDLLTLVSLSPYAFLTGQTTSDPEKAKYFAKWQSEIDFGQWFKGNVSDNTSHSGNNYTLTLESVEYIPSDDELNEQDDDGYDYDEE